MEMPLEARVLLGWMGREQAIRFLKHECIFYPPITEDQVEQLWFRYRERVLALTRATDEPRRLPIEGALRERVDEALARYADLGIPDVTDIIRLDPLDLVAFQPAILLDRAASYSDILTSEAAWFSDAVALTIPTPSEILIYSGTNAVNIDLPHGEFSFSHDPVHGFAVREHMRHVSVSEIHGSSRMVLWAGYHRVFARMSGLIGNNPGDRSLLVVLTQPRRIEDFPDFPYGGVRSVVSSPCPPIFRDFYDQQMYTVLRLKAKKFQLQIRSTCVAIDDE